MAITKLGGELLKNSNEHESSFLDDYIKPEEQKYYAYGAAGLGALGLGNIILNTIQKRNFAKVMRPILSNRQNLINEANLKYRKIFHPNAQVVGSTALGINVPGKSDIDIIIPIKSRKEFNEAVSKFEKEHPDLKMNSWSKYKQDKKTFTGKIDNQDADVVFAYGAKGEKFLNAFNNAQKNLTDDKRIDIAFKKKKLQNAWILPKTRYKIYKQQVADNLGLTSAYF